MYAHMCIHVHVYAIQVGVADYTFSVTVCSHQRHLENVLQVVYSSGLLLVPFVL